MKISVTGKDYEDYISSDDGQQKRSQYVLVMCLPDLWPVAVEADGEVTRLDSIHEATIYPTFDEADKVARSLSESRAIGDRLYVLSFAAVLDHEHALAILRDFQQGRR